MSEPDPAKVRFFTLGVIRLAGVVLAFSGIAIIMKRPIEPAEVVGGVLIVLAVVDSVVLPMILVKRWRTPPE